MPKPLKVLAICAEDPELILGGMGRHVRELYKALSKRDDVEVDLLTVGPATVDKFGNELPFTNRGGYRRWVFTTLCDQKPRTPGMRTVMQTDILWMSRILEMTAKGFNWDVIHAHEWSSMQVAQLAARALDLPIVSTMHLCMKSLWDLDTPMEMPENSQELLNNYQERRREKSERPSDEKLKKLEEQIALQQAANLEADIWIANQEGRLNVQTQELILCSHAYCEMSDKYYETNSFFGKQPFMIPNGIDLSEWNPKVGDAKRARASHDKIGWRPIALFVGRIATMKGIEYLLQSITDTDTGYQVVLAGEVNADVGGEDWYVTQWIRALEEKYPHRIAWVGFQRDAALMDLYAAAEVVVMPSTTEPFGIVGAEAMATGTPLISTAVDGLGELVQEGDTQYAIVIPPRDPEAITSALCWLKDNETAKRLYSVLGLQRVKDPKFNWDNIGGQTVEVYKMTKEAWDARSPGGTKAISNA